MKGVFMTENGQVVQLYGDEYIKVDDALEYLESRDVVLKLDNLYYEFNGFATEYELDFNSISGVAPEIKYLKAVARVCPEGTSFWDLYHNADCFEACFLDMVSGYINGILLNNESIHQYHVNGENSSNGDNPFRIEFESCFVKKSEIDELAEEYGIPFKKTTNVTNIINGETNKLNTKSETTYQHIIAALLDYIKGDIPGIEKHQNFTTEAAMIALLEKIYTGYSGMSKRTLESKFALVKKKLEE
ncbi:MAG: hypothetical protein ABGY11_11935 [Candidatus Thioglobus sp.]|jgi:hypothetical protein